VEEFFAGYEARVNAALGHPPVVDVEAMAEAYAEHVIEAHPGGVIHFEKEQFRAAIAQVFERQRSIGAKSMRMVSLEITPVDEHHWSGKVRWEARYEREDTGVVLRSSTRHTLSKRSEDNRRSSPTSRGTRKGSSRRRASYPTERGLRPLFTQRRRR